MCVEVYFHRLLLFGSEKGREERKLQIENYAQLSFSQLSTTTTIIIVIFAATFLPYWHAPSNHHLSLSSSTHSLDDPLQVIDFGKEVIRVFFLFSSFDEWMERKRNDLCWWYRSSWELKMLILSILTKVNGRENQLKFERQETENTQNNTDSNSSFSILSILHFT